MIDINMGNPDERLLRPPRPRAMDCWFWGRVIIGLTIVASGTSLPEVATSVIASMRDEGHREHA